MALIFLGMLVLGIWDAGAMTASPHPIQVSQPDGTRINLRVKGDQDFNWFVDDAGYTVVLHNREYVYATLDAGGWLVPTGVRVGSGNPALIGLRVGTLPSPQKIAAFRNSVGTKSPPAAKAGGFSGASEPPLAAITPTGTIKNLVILCKFSDHDATKIRSREDYDKIFNTVGGDPVLAPTGSVRDYFNEASYGTLTLASTVIAWVTLPNTEAYYGNGNSGLGTYPQNGQRMAEDALALADPLVDFGQFDGNNDGFVDAIDIIHSGYAAETGGGAGNWMWSHKWSLWAVPGGRWTSQDNNSGGVKVKVYDYHTEGALWGSSGTDILRIGVICHETGHFFGLPDLYDTDGSSEGIGSYCLMANSWGFDFTQQHPPHLSAWCKQQLGWASPTVITPGSTYSLPRVALSPTIHRINSGYPTGEYLLIENRQPVGFENVMPQGGLAIWHIDENKASNNEEGYPGQSGWPANNKHYKIALLQADGLYQMERDLNRGNGGDVYHAGGISALTPLTVPNTHRYQGSTVLPSNNHITGISAAGSTMSYTFTQEAVATEDYYTEKFDSTPHDLDNMTFTFTPQAGGKYKVERSLPSAFLTDPSGGTVLTLTDDDYRQVTLTGGKTVSLYGQAYSSLFVSSNGYVSFGSGSASTTVTLADHFSRPAISAFFDDLNPETGTGTISWKQLTDRVVVTWNGISEFNTTNSNSFQLEMFFDGSIRISHRAMAATDGLIGLSKGTGLQANFGASDYSGYPLAAAGLPVFSSSPSSRAVLARTNVVFASEVAGPGTVTCQWYKNDVLIPGAESPLLTIESVLLEDAGSYRVVATNANGSLSSETAILSVTKRPAWVYLSDTTQMYTGTARAVGVATVPADLPVVITYGGSATPPVNAGTYEVTATVVDSVYEGQTVGSLIVNKAPQVISFLPVGSQTVLDSVILEAEGGNSGNAVLFEVTDGPGVIDGGSTLTFTTAGQVSVTASQAGDGNYLAAELVTQTVTVSKVQASLLLAGLTQAFDGSARTVVATTMPPGLPVNLTYGGSALPPVNAGSYAVVATVDHPLYQGTSGGTLMVAKAAATVRLSSLTQTYTGEPQRVTAETTPTGLNVSITYDESPLPPVNAGNYAVKAVINDPNHEGQVQGALDVSKAEQQILFAALPDQVTTGTVTLSATGGGSSQPLTFAVTNGAGQIVAGMLRFTGAGIVTVVASQAGDSNHLPAPDVSRTVNVTRASVPIDLAETTQHYDGSPRRVAVTTLPAELDVQVTYNGSSSAPTEEGIYEVRVSVDTAMYAAVKTGSLTVLRPRLSVQHVSETPLLPGLAVVNVGRAAPGGAPVNFVLTLKNVGSGLLDGLSASLTSGEAADFSLQQMPSATLAAGATTTLEGTFIPTTEGLKTVSLQITSGDFSTPAFVVTLTGTGDHRADRAVLEPDEEAAQPVAEPSRWVDGAVGVYDGLLRDGLESRSLVGNIESLTVARPKVGALTGGAASGRLRILGRTLPFKGTFSDAGVLTASLPQKGSGSIEVVLQLMSGISGMTVRGHVSWQGTQGVADLPRAAFDKKTPVPVALRGSYTLLLPGPAERVQDSPTGDGWATVTVGADGIVKVTGRLADGTAFTESAHLSAAHDFSLFTEIYRTVPKGHFGGRMVVRDVPGISDFDGHTHWLKRPDAREASYPAGFTLHGPALGSRYAAPAPGHRILAELSNSDPNASLSLNGPALPPDSAGEIERVLSWLPTHKLLHHGPETLGGSAVAAQGLITGSYRNVAGTLRVSFLGVAFQKQGLAAGYFLLNGKSGGVRIIPGDGFTYPGSEDAGEMQEISQPELPATALTSTAQIWSPTAVGTYHGVLSGEEGSQGGLENLVVNARKLFTATLWIKGVRYPISGTLDDAGKAEVSAAGGTLVIELQLVMAGGALQMSGLATLAGQTYTLDAQKLPGYNAASPSPQAGNYTLAVVAPENGDLSTVPGGNGHGLLKVAVTGVCTGTLTLADGSTTTFAGHVSQAGEWSVHRALHGAAAGCFLAGKLTFRDVAEISDVDGVWHWEKKAGATPKSPLYPGGFSLACKVVGSRYVAPAKDQRAWPLLGDQWHNIWLRLDGPDMSPAANWEVVSLDRVMTWSSANKQVYFGPEKITLSTVTTSGLVSGTVVDKVRNINQRVSGVLLQKQGIVTGSYQAAGQSGWFTLQRRDEPF